MKTAAEILDILMKRHFNAGLCISCLDGPRKATTPWGQCKPCAIAGADDVGLQWSAFRAGVDVASVSPGDPVTWVRQHNGTAEAHGVVEAMACDLAFNGELAIQSMTARTSRSFRQIDDGNRSVFASGQYALALGHHVVNEPVAFNHFIKLRSKA